jgi:hypothetical protein
MRNLFRMLSIISVANRKAKIRIQRWKFPLYSDVLSTTVWVLSLSLRR